MQSKSTLINSNQVWNAKKRYKINEIVTHLGIVYQNITGVNTDPTLETDWKPQLEPGDSTPTFTTLATILSDISNTITTKELVYSYIIPANTLFANGQRLCLRWNDVTSIANVTVFFEINAVSVFGALSVGGGPHSYDYEIYRVNNTTLRVAKIGSGGTTSNITVNDLGLNSNTLNFYFTATAYGGGTIKNLSLEFKP